jgi:hypothetical protein
MERQFSCFKSNVDWILCFADVSGDPDTKIELQSEDDIAEHEKTPGVTEGAVRITDQGIPLTAPSGANTISTFRSAVNTRSAHIYVKAQTVMVQPHVYVYKYEDLAFFFHLCKLLCVPFKRQFRAKHTLSVLNILCLF